MAGNVQNLTPREVAQRAVKSARTDILVVVILTILNIVLLIAGSESFMLFSASIPYYAVCFPAVWGEYELFVLGVIFACVIILLYFLCWLLSKKRPGWLTVALVMFVLDTIGLIAFYVIAQEISGIMDLLIHGLVVYQLIRGINGARKLKKMPAEEVSVPEEEGVAPVLDHATPIRRIGEEEKHRVLLACEHGSKRIVYRRVKRTNQLVINDYIYDEIELLVEPAHSLYANLDGHTYEVGFDGAARSYCKVDGEVVAKKIRWY